MVFLLDESNIHRSDGISSVVLAYVSDLEALYTLDAHILATEKYLSIRPFHWWKSSWCVRERFVLELLKLDFGMRIVLVRNPVRIETVLEQSLPYLIVEPSVHRLIIDGSKPKAYANHLKKILRDKGITVKKLRNETDHARPGLRLADCCAGLIRHHAEQPKGRSAHLYKMIESRIDTILYK